MTQSFGAEMRQQREQRGISLATIAEKTKIKLSLLEMMERDDLSQWPNGFFCRAFIRAYAQAIGVDPDEAVRDFLHFHFEGAEDTGAISSLSPTDDRRASTGPPTRLRQMVGSAVTRFRGGGQRSVPANERRGASVTAAELSPRRTSRVAGEDVPLGDVLAAADLCTKFARSRRTSDLSRLFQETARILDASGLIIWTWDPASERLRASWTHGYRDAIVAQLPPVPLEAENAVAAAFRSGRTSYVAAGETGCGAVVVPLFAASGCAGVLAIELQQQRESPGRVEALATIFAAQLARIVEEPVEEPETPEVSAASGGSDDRVGQTLFATD